MNSTNHTSVSDKSVKTAPGKFRKITSHLLVRIIAAMLAGIAAAYIFPLWLTRIFETFNAIFSQLLGFVIPLIILGFVAPAIAEVGKKAGRMLFFTVVLAYCATLFAGFGSYFISDWAFPDMVETIGRGTGDLAKVEIKPYFTIEMPPLMQVMTALITAFILGTGTAALPAGNRLMPLLGELRSVVTMVIEKVIIPLLPLYILGIFLNMTVSGEVASVLGTFAKIILVIFAIHVAVLLIQFGIASFFSAGSRNPLRLLATMMPAYFTALGTQSSAATIPVTLRQTEKLGVDSDVAGFTVPLCATIHMSGSALKVVACSIAMMLATGMHYDLSMFAGFIFMLGITMVAAPGIPGGAIMAALGIMQQMLGFGEAECALIIALYIAMDSFGTACNVTGDGALSIIVNRFFGRTAASTRRVTA